MPLIQMKAPLLHQHRHAGQGARHKLTCVARDARLWETGDARVGHAPRLTHRLRERAEPRAEHDRDPGSEIAKLPPHGLGRQVRCTFPASRFPLPDHAIFSSSLCMRATSATRSNSGRNALSHAFSTTRTSSSLPSPSAVCAR